MFYLIIKIIILLTVETTLYLYEVIVVSAIADNNICSATIC